MVVDSVCIVQGDLFSFYGVCQAYRWMITNEAVNFFIKWICTFSSPIVLTLFRLLTNC
jgi:hypothetical protein